uniref:hypothetical protein n=1 Tax=Methylobacterium oryzae TaxID=334852 RepID=UPI00155D8D17|nr:hypothetical protein [Methylobacterium oryzae]
MPDARWSDVDYDIKSACRHLEAAARLWATDGFMPSPGLRSGNDADLDAYRAQMALRHALQSAMTSLENGLRRVREITGMDAFAGSPEMQRDLHEMQRTVHRIRRIDVSLAPEEIRTTVEAAERFRTGTLIKITKVRERLD